MDNMSIILNNVGVLLCGLNLSDCPGKIAVNIQTPLADVLVVLSPSCRVALPSVSVPQADRLGRPTTTAASAALSVASTALSSNDNLVISGPRRFLEIEPQAASQMLGKWAVIDE
jgi:hypothetical protein